MYFHLFQEPDGAFFTLEQCPVPVTLEAACESLLALDGFWRWYRYTLSVDPADATRVDCASVLLTTLEADGRLESVRDRPELWDLQRRVGGHTHMQSASARSVGHARSHHPAEKGSL